MIYLIIFLLGLCIGSFLGVLIYREANEEESKNKDKNKILGLKKYLPSWLLGRSYCDYCKKPIDWYDNIPLLSYILLKGKCRYCKKKISLEYPLLELLTGVQFVWVYWLVKSNLDFFSRFEGFYSFVQLLFYLLLGALFLMVLISDIKYQIIPDSGIIFAILLILMRRYFDYLYTGYVDWSFIPAAFCAALFFWSIILLTKGKGMGFGDVKLAFVLGLFLGFPKILVAIFMAFLTGGLAAGILLLAGKKKFKQAIAFGPFLLVGALISLFWGQTILLWYLGKIY